MPLTYRGGSEIATAGQTSLALPTGTQLGDYVVIGGIGNNTVNDARFPLVHNPTGVPVGVDGMRVWTGYATTLVDIALTGGTHEFQGVACATFAPVNLGDVVTNLGSDNTVEVPSAPGTAAICVIAAASSLNGASIVEPPGYAPGIDSALSTGASQVRIDYWDSIGEGSSPAGSVSGSVNVSSWSVWVQGGYVSHVAPPARLYPRSDHLGLGSGRIFPPPSTQQAGRLNSSY